MTSACFVLTTSQSETVKKRLMIKLIKGREAIFMESPVVNSCESGLTNGMLQKHHTGNLTLELY